jgi:nitrite reductase/ring-hydroxylating ferredoxin subunit
MVRRTYEVCRFSHLPDGGSRGFSVVIPGGHEDIFLVRKGEQVFGYQNSCPHTGGPLDWVPDQFLTQQGDLIQCAIHAALFRIEDGLCLQGPCAGQSLNQLAVEMDCDRVSVILNVSGSE